MEGKIAVCNRDGAVLGVGREDAALGPLGCGHVVQGILFHSFSSQSKIGIEDRISDMYK